MSARGFNYNERTKRPDEWMEAEQVGIRRAAAADIESLELVRRLSREKVGDQWPFAVAMSERLAAEGVFTYLAEDREPFGFVSVGDSGDVFERGCGEVLEWYLHPRRWRAGFGQKMIVHGLSVLKRRQYESAVIWLPGGAVSAELVIAGLGFEAAGVQKEDNQQGNSYVQEAFIKDLDDFF